MLWQHSVATKVAICTPVRKCLDPPLSLSANHRGLGLLVNIYTGIHLFPKTWSAYKADVIACFHHMMELLTAILSAAGLLVSTILTVFTAWIIMIAKSHAKFDHLPHPKRKR